MVVLSKERPLAALIDNKSANSSIKQIKAFIGTQISLQVMPDNTMMQHVTFLLSCVYHQSNNGQSHGNLNPTYD